MRTMTCRACGKQTPNCADECDALHCFECSSSSKSLTPAQRLTCLLALLDDVIKKDEDRMQGEWTIESCQPSSHGRNARALKFMIEELQDQMTWHGYIVVLNAQKKLEKLCSLYPDEILKRYLIK